LKPLKFFFGLVLIPLVYVLARLFWDLASEAWGQSDIRPEILWTLYGAGLWAAGWLLLKPPDGLYVAGHGQIEVERTNWLVTLAPYFVPLYMLVCLLLYVVSTQILGVQGLSRFWMFLVGLSYAFHFTYTSRMLFLHRQTDLEREGVFFSLVIILLFNVLIFVAWAVCVGNPGWSRVAEGALHHLSDLVSVVRNLFSELVENFGNRGNIRGNDPFG